MNETEKLASLYLEDRKRRKNNEVQDAISGTITGGSIGFLIPALSTNAAPKKIDKFVKNKKPFGKGLSDQLIKEDADELFLEKVKNENFNVDENRKNQLEQEALSESKSGLNKNPLNKNLAAQTGIGRAGALLGGGIGLTTTLLNQKENKQKRKELKKIVGNNKDQK